MKFCKIVILIITSCLVLMSAANAHEIILKPVKMNLETSGTIRFSVISAHEFMVSQEMEPVDTVTAALIKGKSKTPIKLHPNPVLLTLDGSVACKGEGYSILSAHRKGMVWTHTTQGSKQISKQDVKNATGPSKNYEKFCKTLVKSGNSDKGYDQVIDDKLEIVPLTDPGKVQIGSEMNFKILYDGEPLSTTVYATYDGFSSHQNTYAYYTTCNAQGIAAVKITHPGTWMVRVEKSVDQATKDYDIHVMRAVLVFKVN